MLIIFEMREIKEVSWQEAITRLFFHFSSFIFIYPHLCFKKVTVSFNFILSSKSICWRKLHNRWDVARERFVKFKLLFIRPWTQIFHDMWKNVKWTRTPWNDKLLLSPSCCCKLVYKYNVNWLSWRGRKIEHMRFI